MGLVLKIVLFSILIVGLAVAGIGIYFYKYHVFDTLRMCVSQDAQDTGIPCGDDSECLDRLIEQSGDDFDEMISNAPEFMRVKIMEVFDAAVYCDGTCHSREIYGDGFGGEGRIDSCRPGDTEILQEIRGKEAFEFVKAIRK